MENVHSYFFRPYKGKRYDEGFYNLRSLVVGVCPVCELGCPCHDKCASPLLVREMNNQCPCYTNCQDKEYSNLSNYNTIEIEAFLDGTGKYPAFKSFTYYMLKCAGDLPRQKKCQFWDNVAFTNFLQFLHTDEDVFPKDPKLYEKAYPAFKEIVDELRPEIIYAWSEPVRDCLKQHKDEYAYIGKADMQFGISLYVFSPIRNRVSGTRLSKLRYHLGITSENHHIGWYVKLLIMHIGKSYNGDEELKGKVMHKLANTLMDMVGDGILKASETNLLFNDSDKGFWTSRLKGIFLSALKDQYPCFGRHFNPGVEQMFNEPHMATAKKDVTKLRSTEQTLARMIKRAFPASEGKTFSKDEPTSKRN